MCEKIKILIYTKIPGGEYENNKENTLFADRTVYLTKLNLTGLNEMYEYSKLPVFYKYYEYRPHKTINNTKEYILLLQDRINNGYHGGECMYWFIRLKSTGKVIGSIGLVAVDFKRKSAEVGLGISPEYWGKGHIFEALWILLKYCFDELELERISALTRSDNISVIRLFETAGFKVEGTHREAYRKYDGKRYDAVLLGLLRREATLSRCHAFSKLLLNKKI
jgi:ribosomal-protein-alanine N-acetyltransferase